MILIPLGVMNVPAIAGDEPSRLPTVAERGGRLIPARSSAGRVGDRPEVGHCSVEADQYPVQLRGLLG